MSPTFISKTLATWLPYHKSRWGEGVVEFPRICPLAAKIYKRNFNADFSTFLYKIHDDIL